MSLPTSVAGFFRTQWATRLVDSCVILNETGTTLNTGNGEEQPTYDTIYDGVCLVRPSSASDAEAGDRQVELRGYVVRIPYDETTVTPGMLCTITSTNDTYLDGLQFTIRNVTADTYNHVRILHSEEQVGG